MCIVYDETCLKLPGNRTKMTKALCLTAQQRGDCFPQRFWRAGVGVNALTTPTSSTGHLWTSGSGSWGAIQLSFWDVSLLIHPWYMPAFTHHPLLLQHFLHSRPNFFCSLVQFCDYIFCCSIGRSFPVDIYSSSPVAAATIICSTVVLSYASSALLLPRLPCSPILIWSLSEESIYSI